MRVRHLAIVVLTFLVLPSMLVAGGKTPPLPKGIKLEEQSTDAKAAKILFIAGSNYYKPGEHEYIGGCALLMDLVKQSPQVAPVLALDWPKNPQSWVGVKSIVFFVDGAEKHPILKGERQAQINKLAQAGVGLVMLHQGVDVPKGNGDTMRSWMGAAWEKGYSQRAHWIDTFDKFPVHPITRGVKPFKIDDGYLYKLRFEPGMKNVTPLLRTANPKTPGAKLDDSAVVSWAFERKDGGRSFAFTGGHLHVSFGEEGYRRLLTNAILWTAKIEIPASGAPVALTTEQMNSYLENRANVK
jgi:type 1 glutamine amidotransferase